MQYESGNVIRPDSGGGTKETVSPVSAPFQPKKDVLAKSSSVFQPPQMGPVDLRLTCHDVGGTSEHQTKATRGHESGCEAVCLEFCGARKIQSLTKNPSESARCVGGFIFAGP